MNKKTLIQIIIIIIAFAGSGIVLYNGFSSNSAPIVSNNSSANKPVTAGETGLDLSNIDKTLPYPSSDSFNKALGGVFNKLPLQYGVITYPVISSSSDIGVNIQDLIKPLSTTK